MSLNPFGAIVGLATQHLGQTPFGQLLGMGQPGVPSAPAQPPASPAVTPNPAPAFQRDLTGMPGPVQAPQPPDLRRGIEESALALGIDPLDLATSISYETGGTFDPVKRGPTTQWGQHRGLIQFGEPQAQKYGVNWDDPVGSQLGRDGAIVKYLRDAGVKPGMGLKDVYSAINAGSVGRYDASDANNGGAPGTVADKVNSMSEHRAKAAKFLGGSYSPGTQTANASPMQRVFAAVSGGTGPQVGASAQTPPPGTPAPTPMQRVLATIGKHPTSHQQPQPAQTQPSENNLQEVAYRKQKLAAAAAGTPNQPTVRTAQRKADLRKKIGLSDRV